jgi:hypothetical protein
MALFLILIIYYLSRYRKLGKILGIFSQEGRSKGPVSAMMGGQRKRQEEINERTDRDHGF